MTKVYIPHTPAGTPLVHIEASTEELAENIFQENYNKLFKYLSFKSLINFKGKKKSSRHKIRIFITYLVHIFVGAIVVKCFWQFMVKFMSTKKANKYNLLLMSLYFILSNHIITFDILLNLNLLCE